MHLPKKQNPFDWLTQLWNIVLGRKLEAESDSWLASPIGRANEYPDRFIERISRDLQRVPSNHSASRGLLTHEDLSDLNLNPRILDFYTRTSSFELEVEAHWRKGLTFLGIWASRLFTKRIEQFQLPESNKGARQKFSSQIIEFSNAADGARCALWTRSDNASGEMIFYGVYSTCILASGRRAIKTVFPLPEGNATVVFDISVDASGNLHLNSKGSKYGDSGFYFIVEDVKGCQWKHLIRFLNQNIFVFPENKNTLKAEHRFYFFMLEIYRIDYFLKEPGSINANL